MTMLKRTDFLKNLKRLATATLFAAGISTAAMAVPVTYSFVNITGNNAIDAATGEAQLFVDVDDAGGGLISFDFYNTGPLASSIADVYFDGGGLLVSLSGLIDADDGIGGDAGVDFSPLATPGNVPGANNAAPAFSTTVGLSADSDAPVQPNGVNPGENLIVLLTMSGGTTFADIIAGLDAGTIRTAIHVQGFADGGSESFVNNGSPPGPCTDCTRDLPEPGPLGMFGLGLVLLAIIRRTRKL